VPNIEQADASPSNIFFKAHLFYYSAATLIACASKHFEPLVISNTGNLSVIFRKREEEGVPLLPSQTDLQNLKKRLRQKGWLEYLTIGGGWKKPFKKIASALVESGMAKMPPKDILNAALKS
jgi:lauroyl/myristoyl acyltransferase